MASFGGKRWIFVKKGAKCPRNYTKVTVRARGGRRQEACKPK